MEDEVRRRDDEINTRSRASMAPPSQTPNPREYGLDYSLVRGPTPNQQTNLHSSYLDIVRRESREDVNNVEVTEQSSKRKSKSFNQTDC